MRVQSASLLFLLPFAFWACSTEPVAVDPGQQGANSTETKTSVARTGPLNFAAPEGWVEREPTKQMRFKEFTLGDDAENEVLVVVAYWAGGIGGLQGNLDRWKGQVGGGEGAAEPTIDTYTENGLITTLLDGDGSFTGMDGETKAGTRLMAAYIESPMGRFDGVYTIKLTGPSDVSAPWADSFHKFIQDL